MSETLVFFCHGLEVGYFIDHYPTIPGSYEYMAYRGPGHYELQLVIEAHGQAPCYHLGTDPPTHFVVRRAGDYETLLLSDFDRGPLPEQFTRLIDQQHFAETFDPKRADTLKPERQEPDDE